MEVEAAQTQKEAVKPMSAKPGRKTRKQWRKNIDINDVEGGLDEMREEERIMQPLSDQVPEDMFQVDTFGSGQAGGKHGKVKKLKTDQILEARSKVPALKKIDINVSLKKSKKVDRKLKEKLKKIAGKTRESGNSEKFATSDSKGISYDVWDVKPKESSPLDKPQVKVPPTLKNRHKVDLPAVEVLHPGASYIPTEEHHKELLNTAAEKYMAEINETKRIDAALNTYKNMNTEKEEDKEADEIIISRLANQEFKMSSIELDAAIESISSKLKASEAAKQNADKSDASSDEQSSDEDEESAPSKKPSKRKTKAERNRQKRIKQQQEEELRLKEQKKLRHQLQLAKKLKAEVDSEKTSGTENKIDNQKLKEEREKKPQARYGFKKVMESMLEVKPTDEISGSLRTLKAEGNLIRDSFINKQKRKLIEPRMPTTQKRKPKYKATEKWTFKDFV
ncbi:hypothetical protein H4219_000713 [Mycoemilia scoparia]|uniref:Ribosome biogenesis protein NOP53 n=1 Tax=Mycoemilia scoparia TaxID=417184 RepID=A0A9W8A5B1_9FUNG|nr:hypothetical protein H4219_000713 [Mycoemilia scoparia]